MRTNNRIRLDSRRPRFVRRSIIASFPSQRLIDCKNQSRARMAAFVKIRLGDQMDQFGGPMFIVSFRLRSTTGKSVETRARNCTLNFSNTTYWLLVERVNSDGSDMPMWFVGIQLTFHLSLATRKSAETRARKLQLIYEVQCQPCDSI